MKYPITMEDEEGNVIELPWHWEICSVCRGNGKHSLAVDGHGITQEERERDWDDESWQSYLNGAYDRTCENCDGSGKIQVVTYEALTKDQQEVYDDFCIAIRECEEESRSERRFLNGDY